MKTLYIECKTGAAGDMLFSALLELHRNADEFIEKFNSLGIPKVHIELQKGKKCGIAGTHIKVLIDNKEEHEHEHGHDHDHTHLSDIQAIIEKLPLSPNVRKNALEVYDILAAAESKVHNCEVSHIHFHEVGTMDAVADIVGVCMLMEETGADKIISSPVNVGGGTVKCAHGILPVPAPATAEILKGIPFYSDSDEGEFCTPTGAALLKHFAADFGAMPLMRVDKTGTGLGTKDFSRANILRVFLGETEDARDEIYELNCNIDDMTGEELAFAEERIFEAGARDVFTVPVFMKKGRPAVLLCCICAQSEKEAVIRSIFKHTSTIGIREKKCQRYVLERSETIEKTRYGDIHFKTSYGYGTKKRKPEYEDIAKTALENGLSLFEVKNNL